MLTKPGTEEGHLQKAFCSVKEPCTDGMLPLEERIVATTLQEGEVWIALLYITPPVEIQGQSMAGAARGVDL